MKAPLPPGYKPPFWATKECRILLIGGVMGLAVMAVLVFDIGPMLNQRAERAAKPKDSNAFVPQPIVAGAPRDVKFEGVLEKVKDGTSIDDQEEPYQYLVRNLAKSEAAQLGKDAKTVEYPYFSKMPAETRGQTVKILALFLQSNPIRVDSAPGGVQFIHRTYLSDLSGHEGYVVDLLEYPGELAQRTLVGMDAVFFKLGTYEGKKGPVQAPLFLGKSLHTVKERMAGGASVANVSGGMIVGVAVVVMLGFILLTSRMFRKSKPPAPKGPAISLETSKT